MIFLRNKTKNIVEYLYYKPNKTRRIRRVKSELEAV